MANLSHCSNNNDNDSVQTATTETSSSHEITPHSPEQQSQQSNGTRLKKQQSKMKKNIQFALHQNQVHPVALIRELVKGGCCRNVWYCRDEFIAMTAADRALIKRMPLPEGETEEVTVRGLETRTEMGSLIFRNRIKMAVRAVVKETKRQQEQQLSPTAPVDEDSNTSSMNLNDELIRQVYEGCCESSGKAAHDKAQKDREAVEDYLSMPLDLPSTKSNKKKGVGFGKMLKQIQKGTTNMLLLPADADINIISGNLDGIKKFEGDLDRTLVAYFDELDAYHSGKKQTAARKALANGGRDTSCSSGSSNKSANKKNKAKSSGKAQNSPKNDKRKNVAKHNNNLDPKLKGYFDELNSFRGVSSATQLHFR